MKLKKRVSILSSFMDCLIVPNELIRHVHMHRPCVGCNPRLQVVLVLLFELHMRVRGIETFGYVCVCNIY